MPPDGQKRRLICPPSGAHSKSGEIPPPIDRCLAASGAPTCWLVRAGGRSPANPLRRPPPATARVWARVPSYDSWVAVARRPPVPPAPSCAPRAACERVRLFLSKAHRAGIRIFGGWGGRHSGRVTPTSEKVQPCLGPSTRLRLDFQAGVRVLSLEHVLRSRVEPARAGLEARGESAFGGGSGSWMP